MRKNHFLGGKKIAAKNLLGERETIKEKKKAEAKVVSQMFQS
jgi:hypothetical protein